MITLGSLARHCPALFLALFIFLTAKAHALESWSVYTDPSTLRAFAPVTGGAWAAGRGGLLHLDLASGEVQTVGTPEGLPDTDLVDLLALGDALWIATSSEGLARYRPGESDPWMRFQALPQGLADDAMLCLAEGTDGALWYGTESGYGRIDASGAPHDIWTANQGLGNDDVHALAFQGDTLLVGTAGGLYRMRPGENPQLMSNAPGGRIDAVALLADSIWVLSAGALRRDRVSGESWPLLVLPVAGVEVKAMAAAGAALVLSLGESGSGGRNDRVFRYDPAAGWTDLSAGLPNDYLYPSYAGLSYEGLAATDAGEIWLGGTIYGGTGPGFVHFDGSDWQHYPIDEAPLGTEVKALRLGPTGNLWCMSTVGGARLTDSDWTRYPSDNGFAGLPRFGLDVLEDSQGWVWFNRYSHGFGRLRLADGFQELIANDGVFIIRMAEDVAGNRWFCLDGQGIDVFTAQDTWLHFDMGEAGLPGLVVDGIAPISAGRVALLFRGVGLAVWLNGGTIDDFEDDTWWVEGDGIDDSDGLLEVDTRTSSLAHDGAGGLWVGQSNGLVRVLRQDDGSYRAVSRLGAKSLFGDGMMSAYVRDVAAAPGGVVWAATTSGLSRASLEVYFEEETEFMRWTIQNWANEAGLAAAQDGLFNQDVLAPLPATEVTRLALSPDGDTVWIGTMNGMARLDILPDPPGDPEAVAAAWVYPNPVRASLGHTELRLGGVEDPVNVTVYNLEGQLVREIGLVEPGGVAWNLQTRFGNRAVSGVYLLRLELQGRDALLRVALVR